MSRTLALAAALVALAAVPPAIASTELANKHACTACHATNQKLIGPAFQEIAKRYAGQPDAVEKLAASIKAGGAGRWGPVAMPPMPNIPEAELKALAAWVAAGGK